MCINLVIRQPGHTVVCYCELNTDFSPVFSAQNSLWPMTIYCISPTLCQASLPCRCGPVPCQSSHPSSLFVVSSHSLVKHPTCAFSNSYILLAYIPAMSLFSPHRIPLSRHIYTICIFVIVKLMCQQSTPCYDVLEADYAHWSCEERVKIWLLHSKTSARIVPNCSIC